MHLFQKLKNSISLNNERPAFFINGLYYSYSDLAKSVSKIKLAIDQTTLDSEKIIGIITNDDLETYASVIALWFSGKAYVPINPDNPLDRNENVIFQAGINTIIDSSAIPSIAYLNLIKSCLLPEILNDFTPKSVSDDELVYILFTSGTTGIPKGVPISRFNLASFVDAFDNMNLTIDENDRCLQMFELTFDLSVISYLIPLLKGACVFTIPKDKIKYSYIFELMEEQKLTVSLMVPSMLHYLRNYFSEINLPLMKYSMFCGEALSLDISKEWSNCLPNATIYNLYGPTEDTIFCTQYAFNKNVINKTYHGVLSIGQVIKGTFSIIIDEDNNPLSNGEIGQLCLGGSQLTPGYWNNEDKNKESFFYINYGGEIHRFYKTGDRCICDEQGDLLYLGRIDFQTKIQGFRVELSEIEYHAKAFLAKKNIVAIAFTDFIGNTEVGLAIESIEFKIDSLVDYLKLKLPVYMIPKSIIFLNEFPLNVNGKTDRKELEKLLKNNFSVDIV
jgi:amino acid adenylation domain-containing protein